MRERSGAVRDRYVSPSVVSDRAVASGRVRSVVVTGASSGIGRATALRLDAKGWRVFAGVRREEDGVALSEGASERLVPLRLDITDPAQVAAATERVTAAVGDDGLDGLVNNAGIMVFAPIETVPVDEFRRQLEVNLLGHVAVTQALLPSIRRGRGRLVFVGSVGGIVAYPFGGPYHAAKFGIEAVADCLRQELRPWQIGVSVIEPGIVATSILERGEQAAEEMLAREPSEQVSLYSATLDRFWSQGKKLDARAIPPEKVAKAIERALCATRPRRRYLVGVDARAQLVGHRLVPARAYDWIVAKTLKMRRASSAT
jgi:NAD(P)-dependent dehydrogenase (short-subunit alcohol dehydrogenase family)